MSILVIAFQSFPLPDKIVALKEVAIVDVTSNMEQHFIVKPPCDIDRFSEHHRKTLRYIVDRIHGIPWVAGCISLESVEEQLKKAVDQADLVYVKGLQRVNFLLNLTGCPVHKIVDLDEFPQISKTAQKRPYFQCMYTHPRHNNLRCALEQAVRYRDFLREKYYFGI